MIHIFLCDDDSSYLEYLSEIVDRFFRQNNIEAGIKTFTDGEKLLEEPEMADIVFLDVEMPGKSGIEVGRRIKEKNPYALIFIVSFTEQYLDDAIVCREADIVMIENQRRCVYVCTKDARYEVKGKLEDWEQKLNQVRFCKSHTSFLVNLDYVSRFTKNEIILAKGKYRAHISRRMYPEFCKKYEEYLRRG